MTKVRQRVRVRANTCRARDYGWRTQIVSVFLAFGMMVTMAGPGHAANERRLKLYFTHTKERIDIVYKRNGQYIPSALRKLNQFLRDWRADQSTKMDPRLFDLVWSVYQQMDTREPIHVVSAFRSPKTNNMLRRRGRGVARNSQHTRGKAMDFFIPGVPVEKIRNTGLRMHVGGVGYYPKSGSPFVHLDTGSVRHWPRMSDRQLAKVFPKGDTTHTGTSGKRLARYDEALRRQQQMARAEISPPGQTRNGGVFARIFNRNQQAEPLPTTGQSLTAPGTTPPPSVLDIAAIGAVLPKVKPAGTPTDLLGGTTQTALLEAPQPRPIPEALQTLRRLAATQPQADNTAGDATDVSQERSIAAAWSQFDNTQSADLSDLIAAGETIPQPVNDTGAAQSGGQAPDVAQAVMAALNASRERAPQTATNSAAASIAASILAPNASDGANANGTNAVGPVGNSNPGDNNIGIADDDNPILTAYAPTAPLPDSRPAFTAALAPRLSAPAAQEPGSLTNSETPIGELPVASLEIPSIAPRARPAIAGTSDQLAALPSRGRAALPDLPPIGIASNGGTRNTQPGSERRNPARRTDQPSGSQPSRNVMRLALHSENTLSKMIRQETTRSEDFADLAMPDPYAMAGAFVIPSAIVDNGFSRTSSTLRTDRFTGRAIVATRVALLTN